MELTRRIETYLRRSGMTATRFGREAVRDPRFVFDLRGGRQIGPVVAGRVVAYLEACERRTRR
jgi:hypothetical protein